MAVLGVTGASGFIGAEFIKLARARGHETRLFSRSDPAATPLDLSAAELDAELFRGCDAIIHLAARLPSRARAITEACECWDVNVLGTLKLMEAMRLAGVQRLIHATAANAYAPWCQFPDERSPLYPLSKTFYLGSKVNQELYAHAYGASHRLKVTSLRISSPYGPNSRNAVGRIAAALLRGDPVYLENGGRFGADFILVSDVARALLLVEEIGEDGVWNVGTGERTTMLDIGNSLVRLTEADPSLMRVEAISSPAIRGYPPINIGKIRSRGFEPIGLETGLRAIVDELSHTGSYQS
jgi:UDP-glucose 4-epimerase